MDQRQLENDLSDLPLGTIRYFVQIGSTNDIAGWYAAQGAPDMTLVVANEQTRGRGRAGRHWYTPPEAALAISLILLLGRDELNNINRLTALGALAVCDVLNKEYDLPAKIKWPNDILVGGKKVAGVLVETQWMGDQATSSVLGIGINIAPAAVNVVISNEAGLPVPPTCLESELGYRLDQVALLRSVLKSILNWRSRLATPEFLRTWEAYLAYMHAWVEVLPGESEALLPGNPKTPSPAHQGQIAGLSQDGSLQLRLETGEMIAVKLGEIRLRPVKETKAEEEAYVR